MKETMRQFNVFYDWNEETEILDILAICETQDGFFSFNKQTIEFPR